MGQVVVCQNCYIDSVWDLNQREAKRLAAVRKAFWRDNGLVTCLAEVRRLLGVRPMRSKPTARSLEKLQHVRCTLEKLVIERANEVPVPALLFVPDGHDHRPTGRT